MGKTKKTKQVVDYLDEDKPIHGQAWCCISFLSPEGVRNCSVRGLKIRGIYATREEAERRSKEVNDKHFHVFVGQVGHWLPWDPNPDNIQDQVYQNEELNKLMKAYKEQRAKADTSYKQHKEESMQRTSSSAPSGDAIRQKLRKKLEEREKTKAAMQLSTSTIDDVSDDNDSDDLDKEKELIKQKRKELDTTEKELNQHVQNLDLVNEKLERIEELYNKIHDK